MPETSPAPSPVAEYGVRPVLARLRRDRPSQALFAVLAAVAFLVYASVLPAEEVGGTLSPANITLLSGPLLVFAVVLALALAAVVTLQIFALRQAAAARRAAGGRTVLGGLGFIASLVPSLCCSPVLPAVLAVFGVGASGATATMKTIAPYKFAVLTAILLLFALTGWWTLRRTAAQNPTGDECC